MTFSSREEFEGEWEKNISKGGIFLKADAQPQPRERVQVVVEVQDSGMKLELPGEAVHVTPHGVGVQLDPLSQNIKEDIQAALSGESPAAETDKRPRFKGMGDISAQDIFSMSRGEKIALARRGGTQARSILMRDRDPAVVMNVLLNPRITVSEVIQITASKGLTLDMIKVIIKKPEWLTVESICLNLVLHPKTPLPTAISLVDRLSEKHVRMIAKRPVKQQIKKAALRKIITK